MRNSIVHSMSFALLLGAAVLSQAAPAKTKFSPPSDWVSVESKTYHLSYSVPKTWTQSGSDGSVTFDLTPAKLKEKGKNLGTLQVIASQSPSITLDSKTDELRESLPKATANSRLSKDEATTIGGDHPAWVFIVETSTKSQQAPPRSSSYVGGAAVPHEIVKKSHTYIVVAVEGDLFVQATFAADQTSFGSGLSLVNHVLDTFTLPRSTASSDATAATPAGATTPGDVATTDKTASDQVKIENKAYHFFFYVPKKWAKTVQNDTQTTFFMLPAKKGAPSPALFNFVSAKCHPTTVEALADTARSDMSAHPEVKILDDKAAELGGKPAWLISTQETAMVPSKVGPGASGSAARTVARTAKMVKVLSTQGEASFEITMIADVSSFDDDLVAAKKVLDTFTWTTDAKP